MRMALLNKDKIKNALTNENIYKIVSDWGGEPQLTQFGIISSTICHNEPGEGSHKLYYYNNSKLFRCYTGCDTTFDIFELVMKVFKIQQNRDISLYEAIYYIASYFGILEDSYEEVIQESPDWDILKSYNKLQKIDTVNTCYSNYQIFNNQILDRFNYNIKIIPWEKDGISKEAMNIAKIGYYPAADAITIPHFDINNNLIGIRGRMCCLEDIEFYGKYRPLKINGILYNHPLGLNLYNLNLSKNNIKKIEKAIIFEAEKSALLYKTFFGEENDISTACCGSSISAFQIELLIRSGAKEIIVALDRQFQEINDEEHQHLIYNLTKIHQRFCKDVLISFIFDKNKITSYKASPIDEGKEKFIKLFKERIIL